MLGPSGCGKTTTMRMIAGFEEPTRGTVRLDGRDVTAALPNKRDVNMVFQSYALFPHMSVFENVAFGLRRKSERKDQITRQVAEPPPSSTLPASSSDGPGVVRRPAAAGGAGPGPGHPAQSPAAGRAVRCLDLKLRQAMQVELKRIQREVGITFVYVTHDQNEALTMSDRIAVMNDGVIEHLGPPREIYEHPATRFVAGFIGTSNLLTGSLAQVTGGQGVIEVSPDERIIVPAGRSGLAAGQEVELTVRPEKIELAAGPGPAGGCALRGTVTEVVYLGTSTSFSVRTTTGADVVVFQQNSASSCCPGQPGRRQGLADLASAALLPDWLTAGVRGASPPARTGCGLGLEVPMDDQHGSDPGRETGPDPSLWRGLTQPRLAQRGMSRRQLLRVGGRRSWCRRHRRVPGRLRSQGRHGHQQRFRHPGRRVAPPPGGPAEAAPHGELRQLAVLHRRAQGQAPVPGALHPDHRHPGHLHRADQRQPALLRKDPAVAAGQAEHRLRPHRDDQQQPAARVPDRLWLADSCSTAA